MDKVHIKWQEAALAALEQRNAEDKAHAESRKTENVKWFINTLQQMFEVPAEMSNYDAEKNEVVVDGIRFARRRYYTFPGSDGYEETFIIKTYDDGDDGNPYDAVLGPIRNAADVGRYLKGEPLFAPGSLQPIPKPPGSDFFASEALASVDGDDREIQQGIIFGLVAIAKAISERS